MSVGLIRKHAKAKWHRLVGIGPDLNAPVCDPTPQGYRARCGLVLDGAQVKAADGAVVDDSFCKRCFKLRVLWVTSCRVCDGEIPLSGPKAEMGKCRECGHKIDLPTFWRGLEIDEEDDDADE